MPSPAQRLVLPTGESHTGPRDHPGGPPVALADIALIGLAILVAALIGIYSRRAGLAASFWPANPLMVGLLIRMPRLARPHGWAAAFVAFMAADLMTGGSLERTFALTAGNLAAIAGAWIVLAHLSGPDRRLERAGSIVRVAGACGVGAAVAAATGLYLGPTYFDMSALDAAGAWFGSELAGNMALLPVILTFPAMRRGIGSASRVVGVVLETARRIMGPFALLVALLAIGAGIGGPAAIAAAVPALLWCALSVGVFETTLLTLIATAWTMVAVAHGGIDLLAAGDLSFHQLTSVQIALSLVAMGPIAVAADVTARDRAFQRLRQTADRDALTGALTRRAFDAEAERLLLDLAAARRPVAVLMADIDEFKTVNDVHGHAAGDRVLRRLGGAVTAGLRDSDIFGRLGGDEFCIVLPGISEETSVLVAERVRDEFTAACLRDDPGVPGLTVSVGVVRVPVSPRTIGELLAEADRALYAAKDAGRDRVVVARVPPAE